MESSARESYFTTEIMTATPQRLQLMLIEAAIRLAERARERRRAGQNEAAGEDLVRAQEIVAQMLSSLNPQADAALAKKAAGVYLFVCRSLMEANLLRDDAKLNDAIRVLEIERETWRLVCQKLDASEAPRRESAAVSLSHRPTGPLPPSAFPPAGHSHGVAVPEGGLSFEA
jgi:flagellar protein FliS